MDQQRISDQYQPPQEFPNCTTSNLLMGEVMGVRGQGCSGDGTLVRNRFIDAIGRPTVDQRVSPDGLTSTFTLKKQNITVVESRGKILSYSNGNQLYSFDPSKQKMMELDTAMLPQLILDDAAVRPQAKPNGPTDLGGGLSALRTETGIVYTMPDGVQVAIGQYGLSRIKGKEFDYDFKQKSLTNEDPHIPRDFRLHEPIAIEWDVKDMMLVAQNSPWQVVDIFTAKQRLADHISQMPKDKQVAYVQALQKKMADMEKNDRFTDRMSVSYETNKDGTLKSVDVIYGSYLPYVTVPVERVRIWGR